MIYNVNLLESSLLILFFAYKNQYYLQVYLENCDHKIKSKQMTSYLDENLFEDYML